MQDLNIYTKKYKKNTLMGRITYPLPFVTFESMIFRLTTRLDVKNPVNNGMNYQPQLVLAGFRNSIMKQQTVGTLEFPGKQKSSNSASQNSAQRAFQNRMSKGWRSNSETWKFTLQGDDHIENHRLKSANW